MTPFPDLGPFFQPRRVAIIGASANPERISGRPLRFFRRHGFAGDIYPINPGRAEIGGLRCYPSIRDVPDSVDLAVVAVDASLVISELEACARRGVRFAVVFSGGFAEVGAAGMAAQARIEEIAARTGMRVSGPNTIGSANLHNGTCPSFAICLDRDVQPGPIGFVSQSGAFGSAIVGQALDEGMGIGMFACTGNEVDLDFSDYVHHMITDQRILSVAGYVEGLRDGAKFLDVADAALERGKPLVMLKVGRSTAGALTAGSHTGSMTGSDRVYEAVFRQKGVLRAHDTDELLDYALLCAMAPEPAGNRVGILSISGGANVMMADACEGSGLHLPELAPRTLEALRRHIPAYGALHNPVDLTGQFINSPGALPDLLHALRDDDNVDAVVFFMSVMYPHEEVIVASLADAVRDSSKPIVVVWTAGPPNVLARLRRLGVPALAEPTRAVRALGGYCRFAALRRNSANGRGVGALAAAAGVGIGRTSLPARGHDLDPAGEALSAADGAAYLARYGLPLVAQAVARTVDEAEEAARQYRGPVALKLLATGLSHKSDAGAVRLSIADVAEVRRHASDLLAAGRGMGDRDARVLVQPMVRGVAELIVGIAHDQTFGPVVVVGLGGVLTELVEDIAVGIPPLSRRDALDLIARTKASRLLASFRGRPPGDVDAVVELVLAASRIALDGEVRELDLNPVIVLERGAGCVIVDNRVLLGGGALATHRNAPGPG